MKASDASYPHCSLAIDVRIASPTLASEKWRSTSILPFALFLG